MRASRSSTSGTVVLGTAPVWVFLVMLAFVFLLFPQTAWADPAPGSTDAPGVPGETGVTLSSTTTTTTSLTTSLTTTTSRGGSTPPSSGPAGAGSTSTVTPTTIMVSPTTTVPPGPSEETLQRLRELEALSSQISAKQYLVYKAAIELDEIDRVLATTVEEYNLRVLELEDAQQKAERLQRELELVREELAAAEEALQERVVGAYKSDLSALDFLLATTDISDFIRRLGLLVSIVRNDQRRVDQVGSLRARSDRLLDEASRRIYDVTTASRLLEEQKAQIEAKLAERQTYVDLLSAEVRALVDQQRRIAADVVPAGFDLGSYMLGDGSAVVKTAFRYLGIPYVWGGATPSGFDCSGLLQYVFMQHGLYLPHYSRYQAQMGFEVPLEDIAPGDLVSFGDPVYHIGMYIGDGFFIHAPRTGDVVKISPLAARTDRSHIRRLMVPQPLESLLTP
ncbi:MAG: C40 family peptidase [Thermoleophilia bacterium]